VGFLQLTPISLSVSFFLFVLGVGRTGTVVAIEACLRMLLAGLEVSVYNVLKEIRSKRYYACQTDLQYLYVHRAILAYITSKKVGFLIRLFMLD
jgi:protein tyrosine phosphatase